MNSDIDLIVNENVSTKLVLEKNQLNLIAKHFFYSDSSVDIFIRKGIAEMNPSVVKFVKAYVKYLNLR